jgi:tRNA(fMet)-specific endonuclease VapC
MGKVIDSSVLIAAERGHLDLAAALTDHRDESFAISAVTASELLHGVHRVPSSRRAATEVFVEGLIGRLPVLPFDLRSARVHARLWAESVANGTQVGERDLMIAATALAYAHEVITRDEKSFPRIPGLIVSRW